MIKVVLDTNIWLSGLFWKGECYKLIEIAEKNTEIIITKEIISEIVDVLNREAKFQRFIENRNLAIKFLLKNILKISNLIIVKSKIDIIKEHPEDNRILEAAIDGKVNYIITYDNHLLKIKEYNGIKIIKPRDFFRIL